MVFKKRRGDMCKKYLAVILLFVFLAGCAAGGRNIENTGNIKYAQPPAQVKLAQPGPAPIQPKTGYTGSSSPNMGGQIEVDSQEEADEITYIPPVITSTAQVALPQPKSAKPAGAVLTKQEIQAALKNAGFYKGAIDGKIGPVTQKAIKAFQSANGLKADGIIGPKTSEALSEYLSE